ncbi:FAD-binding domain-containing protein [Aspergillus californicus]
MLLPYVFSLTTLTAASVAASESVSGKFSFYTPSWEAWDEHAIRWSSWKSPTFSAIFKPETELELSQGMGFLSRNNMSYLATKNAGHGNTPTLGAYQDVVQLNLENFRQVTMNDDYTVTVGGGAKWMDIIPVLHNAGREMTVGSFPCVGVHGVVLGGGMGRLMGTYSLTSDGLRRAKVALWNGTIVEASEEKNADLFWAIRGAGHNFGVVLESTFETWPDKGGLHYNADMVFTDDSLEGVINVANRVIEEGLDPAVGLIIGYVFNTDFMKPLLVVNIVFAHDEKAGRELVANFASTPEGAEQPITQLFFKDTMLTFAELGSGAAVPGVCDGNQNQDLYTASSPTMFDTAAMKTVYESFGEIIASHPIANASILLFETTSRKAIAEFPADYTAYAHRGKLGTNAIIQMTWDGDASNDDVNTALDSWGKETRNLLAKPEISGYDRPYVYINYANDDEPLSALYGYDDWRHQKLTELKRKYDPHGFFNAYRPIPTDMAGWEHKEESAKWSINIPFLGKQFPGGNKEEL